MIWALKLLSDEVVGSSVKKILEVVSVQDVVFVAQKKCRSQD